MVAVRSCGMGGLTRGGDGSQLSTEGARVSLWWKWCRRWEGGGLFDMDAWIGGSSSSKRRRRQLLASSGSGGSPGDEATGRYVPAVAGGQSSSEAGTHSLPSLTGYTL